MDTVGASIWTLFRVLSHDYLSDTICGAHDVDSCRQLPIQHGILTVVYAVTPQVVDAE